MKQGYIVWNQTTYGDGYEVFGVFKTEAEAEKHLDKVFKTRFGKEYSKCSLNEICNFEDDEDSFKITPFVQNDGDE